MVLFLKTRSFMLIVLALSLEYIIEFLLVEPFMSPNGVTPFPAVAVKNATTGRTAAFPANLHPLPALRHETPDEKPTVAPWMNGVRPLKHVLASHS